MAKFEKTTGDEEKIELEENSNVSSFKLKELLKVDRNQQKSIWSFNGSTWEAEGTIPSCENPFLVQSPVDIDQVIGALWPGQVRGGDYKGHGGFRFSEATGGNIEVVAPVGGYLVQASQYLEMGEKQYLLFFSIPCGYFYRFDHILTLSSKLEQILRTLPPATEGDSRTEYIVPPVWIDKGEIIAAQVGILPDNIFIDFGLYDVRKPNDVIPNYSWADKFDSDVEFGHYGVCFFDNLPDNHGEIMRSLPTGVEGKKSDYCN
jgi:hypothetical protein